MTERSSNESDLPESVEALLRNPKTLLEQSKLPTDASFERMARAVEARVLGAEGQAAVEEWLLGPALPRAPGEGSGTAQNQAGNAAEPELSLQEIARAALLHPKLQAVREADGPVSDRISQIKPLGSSARRPLPPSAAAVGRTVTGRAALSSVSQVLPLARVSASAPVLVAEPQQPASSLRPAALRAGWAWFGGALAVAATLVVVFGLDGASPTAPLAVVHKPEVVSAAQPHGQAIVPEPAARSGAEVSGLPLADDAQRAAQPQAAQQLAAEPGAQAVARASLRGAEPKSGEPHSGASSAARTPGADSASGAESLGPLAALGKHAKAKHAAASGASSAAPPAAEPVLTPASLGSAKPAQPSLGAAQGAIGTLLPAARTCIGGQFEPSRANVVFGSDGRVRDVQVTGPAAGTPAEACIRRVLGGARVGPFSDETFSVRTTVRP